jgi:anti-sigma-K factor RskA
MDRELVLELIPAYALGALDADERAAVEALLATDADARQLLAEYQTITDHLSLMTPARRAPAHLQSDLRGRLAAQRAPQMAAPPTLPVAAPPPARPAARPGRVQRLWLPLTAAAAIVLVAAALLLLRAGQTPADPGEQLFTQIVAQADARQIPITASENQTAAGEMVLTADGSQAVIRVEQLPSITAQQTFQLWLIDAEGAHSGGLLQFANAQASNYIVLPLEKPVQQYTGFGLSIEPAGGSPNPDGPSGTQVFGVSVPA